MPIARVTQKGFNPSAFLYTLPVPRTNLLIAVSFPLIKNVGTATARLGIKLNLIHQKAGADDTLLRYTPRSDDPDAVQDRGKKPGIITDQFARNTGFEVTARVTHVDLTIPPGEMNSGSRPAIEVNIPGTTWGPEISAWWAKEGRWDFKVRVWLFDLTLDDRTVKHEADQGSFYETTWQDAIRIESSAPGMVSLHTVPNLFVASS